MMPAYMFNPLHQWTCIYKRLFW